MTDLHRSSRIASVDILRGLIMIIMALDHVREFWSVAPFRPEDLSQTSGALFFTRWITHFCAPIFFFLSGISIFFVEERKKSKREVSIFLLTRGFRLIALQVLVLSFFLQFSFNMIILEVIWALGWSMVLMSMLIWLPRWVIGTLALAMIVGHNLLPSIEPRGAGMVVLAMLHNTPSAWMPGGLTVIIAYTIIPLVGVMAAGYLMGNLFSLPQHRQTYWWRVGGASLLILFVLVRLINIYGDPIPWSVQERGAWFTFLSFLNVSKYPPSLVFLLLTLGVGFLALSVLDKVSGSIVAIIRTFGQVPFFFYLLHVPLIVLGAYLWIYFSYGQLVNLAFQPPDQFPAGYEPSLIRTYGVWIIYLLMLYFPCRWYSEYKRRNTDWWLSYV